MGRPPLRRCRVGRDVAIVLENEGAVWIESHLRLRPGTVIELTDHRTRQALVISCVVARLGIAGPVYRGVCCWEPVTG